MHARIQFDMDGPSRNTLFLSGMDEGVHQPERVHLRFQVVVEHGLEGRHLGIHDHDVLRDAVAAQRHPLVGHGHGQVVYPVVLQRLGHFHSPGTVSVGLHHTHQLGLRLEKRAVVVQVVHQGIEVDLQNSLVHFLLQLLRDVVEAKGARPLDEHHFVTQRLEDMAVQEVLRRGKEILFFYGEETGSSRYGCADTDELVDTPFHTKAVDLSIEGRVGHTTLVDVAQDECAPHARPASHEVEGDVQRVDVGIIGVVDELATADALFDLQTHSHRLQPRHAVGQLLSRESQIQGHGSTGEGAGQRGLVEERQLVSAAHTSIYIGNLGGGTYGGNALYKEGSHAILTAPANLLALVV